MCVRLPASGAPTRPHLKNNTVCMYISFLIEKCVIDRHSGRLIHTRREYSRSNQLARQKEMMADFCYTNPTIVPGEELSRRGFSMYSGSNHHYTSDEIDVHGKDYTHQEEGRSKF